MYNLMSTQDSMFF